MAAGVTLAAEQFKPFAEAFDREVRRCLSTDDLAGIIHTDGELAPELFTLETAELLRFAGPWGQGFPEPSFDGVFRLLERRIVGNGHLKLVLMEPATGARLEAIAFNENGEHLPPDCNQVRIVYRPDVNEYLGERRLQLLVDTIEPA